MGGKSLLWCQVAWPLGLLLLASDLGPFRPGNLSCPSCRLCQGSTPALCLSSPCCTPPARTQLRPWPTGPACQIGSHIGERPKKQGWLRVCPGCRRSRPWGASRCALGSCGSECRLRGAGGPDRPVARGPPLLRGCGSSVGVRKAEGAVTPVLGVCARPQRRRAFCAVCSRWRSRAVQAPLGF